MVSNIFLIFTPTWGRFPFWLMFFRWVGWNHQQVILHAIFRYLLPFQRFQCQNFSLKPAVGENPEGLCSTSETGPDFSTVGNVEKNGAMAITWKLMQMMRWCHHYQNHGQVLPSEVSFFFLHLYKFSQLDVFFFFFFRVLGVWVCDGWVSWIFWRRSIVIHLC